MLKPDHMEVEMMDASQRHQIRLDIGCGPKKRAGYVGIDVTAQPGVDHVCNFETDRLPFADRSVESVYSSHCFEHLKEPNNIWREISRVIKPGGGIEIWTPFAHSDEAFLPGHIFNWSTLNWTHVTTGPERFFYSKHFLQGGFWRWKEVRYAIPLALKCQLDEMKIPVRFAIKHMVNIVTEWGCFFEYTTRDPGEHEPAAFYVHDRYGEKMSLGMISGSRGLSHV